MSVTLIKLLGVFILAYFPMLSWAQDEIQPMNGTCEKRYVLAFQNDAPGFFIDKKNQKNGTAYELLLEVVRRLGCKSTEQITPYLTLRDNFLRNRADMYALTTQVKELDAVAEFVEMYSFPRSLVVSKKASTGKDTIASVLKNPKILFGNVVGGRLFIQPQELTDLESKHRVRDFPGPTEVFKSLLDGRIQATFSSPSFTYFYITRENKMEQFRSIPDPSGEVYRAGFYLSRKRLSETERQKIRKIILEMRSDGTLLRISRKYVNEEDLKYYKPLGQ
jgi:ABC-type amino acid transport substrate-binding protein